MNLISSDFPHFEFKHGLLFEYRTDQYHSLLYSWIGASRLSLERKRTSYFGFVYSNPCEITTKHNTYNLIKGQYFCIPSQLSIKGGAGIIIEHRNFLGLESIGGPIESVGRLRYINGCTDTLLIPPVRIGNPCFNALYFPEDTNQTSHTHPTIRIGVVVSGEGECILQKGSVNLFPGLIFVIPPEAQHAFRTRSGKKLTVITFHPDSNFGPQDEDHPMINRTIVNGVEASILDSIKTKT